MNTDKEKVSGLKAAGKFIIYETILHITTLIMILSTIGTTLQSVSNITGNIGMLILIIPVYFVGQFLIIYNTIVKAARTGAIQAQETSGER